ELHGGSVRAWSDGEGKGATFTVALPLTVLQADTNASNDERQHPRLATAPLQLNDLSTKLNGVRALVVDDEADARALVQRLLEDCGAVVNTAGSADEAIALLTIQKFDVLISD